MTPEEITDALAKNGWKFDVCRTETKEGKTVHGVIFFHPGILLRANGNGRSPEEAYSAACNLARELSNKHGLSWVSP